MNLNALEVFVRVGELGSFSRAATDLGLAKSTVSQRVADLEAELGVQLLARTTRSVGLTEAGKRLCERGRRILDAASEAAHEVSELHSTPVGHLRVTAPVSFGRRYIGKVVADLLSEHPQLSIDVDLEDRDADLILERYDIAVRVGELPSSTLSVRKVGRARWYPVASPSYLDKQGRPSVPEDLHDHECLLFSHRRRPAIWTFSGEDGGPPFDLRVQGRFVANHGDLLADTAAAGHGVAWLPDFITEHYLRSGELERVLEPFCETEAPIQLVFPDRRRRTLKVALFVSALEASFRTRSSTRE
ncbi:MAG: LysR family transcriptional regulator [Myxococcota bacterium]